MNMPATLVAKLIYSSLQQPSKYIIVSKKHWTEEEIDKLNIEYLGYVKWIFGD